MAKHPRKRQKLTTDDSCGKKSKRFGDAPLGSSTAVDNEAEKDDEERRLESILFGTKFVPRDVPGMELFVSDEGESVLGGDSDGGDGDGQMQHLADSDLFFVDDGAPAPIRDNSESEEEGEEEAKEDSDADEARDHEGSDVEDEALSSSSSRSHSPSIFSQKSKLTTSPPSRKPTAPQLKTATRAAWTDPSDGPLTVSLAHSHPRLRKLRDVPDEDVVTGKEYESRLRRQFERIHPEPAWAAKARKSARRRKKKGALGVSGSGEEEEGDDGDDDDDPLGLLNTTSGILATGRRRTASGNVILPPEKLSIERLRDANQSVQQSDCGPVRVVAFHPSDKVPVLCVGTSDRRIRLFNVDGHTSPLLQTLHIPSLPITSQASAQFHPSGSSLLLTGPRPFFYTHDLQSGTTTRHARGLWGATFSAASDTTTALLTASSSSYNSRKRSRNVLSKSTSGFFGEEKERNTNNQKTGGIGEGMELTAFSPYPGDLLAVAGRGGHVHLVDWKSGAGQVVTSLRCGTTGGGVKSLWWVPPVWSSSSALGRPLEPSSASSRPHLAVLSGDAEVYLWDIGERRCVRRWKDEGGFRGAGRFMAGAVGHEGDGWLAVGSNSGLVNVYGADSFSPDLDFILNPKPIKTIANLVTPISTLRFNHDAQLLAIASQEKKDAMRLIHLPSLTAFVNWPSSSTPLGHVTTMGFSARSEYLAIGNTRGRVLLYHLQDYTAASAKI